MRILVYASVDLNLIDGSSVWASSLLDILTRSPDLTVFLLLKAPLLRNTLLEEVQGRANLTVIDPWQAGTPKGSPIEHRLSPQSAHRLLCELDPVISPDTFIIRDDDLALLLADDAKLRSRCWFYFCNLQENLKEKIQKRAASFLRSGCLLAQTQQVRQLLCECLSFDDPDRILQLPPMIPDFTRSQPRLLKAGSPRLVYSGKFSPHYMALESIQAFREIRQSIPNAEFFVLGDKFHNTPPTPDFENLVKKGLSETEGVFWQGGVSRSETLRLIDKSHIGSCWRHSSFDNNLEVSTKALEYASMGLPVLLNPSPAHRDIFGGDYAGFVRSQDDFVRTFVELSTNPTLYEALSAKSLTAAEPFTFKATSKRLLTDLEQRRSFSSPRSPKKTARILVAGHKLNFLNPLLEYWKCIDYADVRIDTWKNHTEHDEQRSKLLLEWADIIFCEWCLGNAVWYSRNARADQKLLIRLHHQEMNLPYLDQVSWNNVNGLIVICNVHFQELLSRFPDLQSKIFLIYNLFNTNSFRISKRPESEFNLGFIGMVPQRKWPHLAIEILSKIRPHDPRYRLFFLGHPPSAYPWMQSRPDELKYYDDIEHRLTHGPDNQAITREAFTDDVPNWLSKIGFLLSTSEHEGSHQAVAEAMASGAIPIIRNWHGADQIYPECFVYRDIDDAVQMVLDYGKKGRYHQLSEYCTAYAAEKFDIESVWPQIRTILET